GALVRALVRLFEELGGTLRLNSRVLGIEFESRHGRLMHRVESSDAEPEWFDRVVSNADLHHTYAKLYRNHPAALSMQRRLEHLEWSMSLFVLYFGTDRVYDNLAHHSVVFGPRYREHLREIFDGPALPRD